MLRLLVFLFLGVEVMAEGYNRLYWLAPGFRAGTSIILKGQVPSNASRFSIGLCRKTYAVDCDLTIDIKYPLRKMTLFRTRNALQSSFKKYPIPISKGSFFTIRILITVAGYKIYVNANHNYMYQQAMPPSEIRFLYYGPDVKMNDVVIKNKLREPDGQWYWIAHGLHNDNVIIIKGRIASNVERFDIRLCKRTSIEDCDLVITIHFSTDEMDLSKMNNGVWVFKKTYPNPIERGSSFSMRIQINTLGYKISINAKQAQQYYHPLSMAPGRVHFVFYGPDITLSEFSLAYPRAPVGYWGKFKDENPVGKVVEIVGTIPRDAKSVRFALCSALMHRNCALVIDIDFQRSYLTLETRINYHWAGGIRFYSVPILRGHKFLLRIHINKDSFEIEMNKQVYTYPYRTSVRNTEFVYFTGAVNVHKITIK